MEQTGQDDLFDVKLNAYGREYIRKFATWARVLIVLGIITSLILITEIIIRLIKFDASIYTGDSLLLLQQRIYPVYITVYLILFLLQLYFYGRIRKYLLKASHYNDESALNTAFESLYRNAVFGVMTFIISVAMNFLDFYLMLKYYLN